MACENLEMHSTVKWEVESIPIRDDVLGICTRDETGLFDDCMSPPVVRIAEGNVCTTAVSHCHVSHAIR